MDAVVLTNLVQPTRVVGPEPVSPGLGVHDGLAVERFQQLMQGGAPEASASTPTTAPTVDPAAADGADLWKRKPHSLGDAILKTFDAMAADGRTTWGQIMHAPLKGMDTATLFEFQRTVIKFTVTNEYFGKGVGKVVQNTESVVRQTT